MAQALSRSPGLSPDANGMLCLFLLGVPLNTVVYNVHGGIHDGVKAVGGLL